MMILRVMTLLLLLGLLARLLKGRIAPAFLISACVAGPLLGLDLFTAVRSMVSSVLSSSTLRLVVFVECIMLLSGLMASVGSLDRVAKAVRGALGNARSGMGVLPPLVGLLPMPGGALFSAPLVDAAVAGTTIDRNRRAVSNFWFRHISEFWWPLYPGVIAALELSGIAWSTWVTRLILLSPLAALVGWIFILRPLAKQDVTTARDAGSILSLLKEMVPVFLIPLVVLASNVVSRVYPLWMPDDWVALLGGVGAAIISIVIRWRPRFETLKQAVYGRRMVNMALLLITLMAYKGVISESNMAVGVAQELSHVSLPLLLVVSVITFLGGVVTGIAVGFVGATFPIVVAMLSGYHGDYTISIAIGFVWGFMGMMVSPMHLCLLVTKEHFKAEWREMFRLLLPIALVTGIMSTVALLAIESLAHPSENHSESADGSSVRVVGSVRKGKRDDLFLLQWPGRLRTPLFPTRQSSKRWPVMDQNGHNAAFIENGKGWNLAVGNTRTGQIQTLARRLVPERAWMAWSPGSVPTLAVSCQRKPEGRQLLVWKEGDAKASPLKRTLGARCPFWIGDSLFCFVPEEAGWALTSHVLHSKLEASLVCTGLPNMPPRECAVSTDGSYVAYVGSDPAVQPPQGRLFLLSLTSFELSEVELSGSDLSAPEWTAPDSVLFLSRQGMTQHLLGYSVRSGYMTEICTFDFRILGGQILSNKQLVIGITPMRGAGSDYELVVANWDGMAVERFAKRGRSFWGVSAP
jgi:integral membrane protein (TIGR00529 family)